MDKHKQHQNQSGSITVFLSITLLLILALVMTVIEGARQATARVFAERALTTSMDSVLAAFYGPLMEEYHLLGLDGAYGEASFNGEELEERMQNYMSYTLKPAQGIPEASSRMELYGLSLDSVEVQSSTSLTDYQGKIFIHEVVEYMKYRTLGDVAEFFLDKVSLLEQPGKVSILYEEKAKLEKQLVAIDEGILALMKYIDGIATGKNGIIKGRDGRLKTETHFAKRILYGVPTMESAGINNEIVFIALWDNYTDPSEAFRVMDSCLERLEIIRQAIKTLENNLYTVQEEIKKEENALQQLRETLSAYTGEDEAYRESMAINISEAEERIAGLEENEETIRSGIKDYSKEQADKTNSITANVNEISSLLSGSLTATEQGILELEQIIAAAKDSNPLIKAYEESLHNEKEGLDENVYESLEEGLSELKRYQLDNSGGYDFPGMKSTLTNNYGILQNCIDSLNSGHQALSSQDFITAKDNYKEAYRELMTYDTKGLKLNYSTLVIGEDSSTDYLDGMKELIEAGITGLVINPDSISSGELSADMLPSVMDGLSGEQDSFSFLTLLKGMKIGGKDAGTEGLFGIFGDYGIRTLLGTAADEILERVMVQRYIEEHFYRFPVKEEELRGRKPTVLSYEWEYLLYGRAADKDNIEAVIGKLILIRTLLNFVTILGDKEKWNEAKTIATTLVGFTGLPILVAITQGILMIVLAIGCGLVDTCALLEGKEIPILRKKAELKYADLLLLTRENIRKKADAYKEEKGFSYQDYMTLFLYTANQRKLSYRMMDLIQENIHIRYDTDFKLKNCIFGYEARAAFRIKPLFTTLSFMKKYVDADSSIPIILEAAYSY